MNSGSGDQSADNVDIDITIAGESLVKHQSKGLKYSFTLKNTDGTNRISNLEVVVKHQATGKEVFKQSQSIDHSVLPFSVFESDDVYGACLELFPYNANAGIFGNDLLKSSLIQAGLIGDIIGLNQYGSTSSCGNAAIAKLDQLNIPVSELEAGEYEITVKGTIKSNSAAAGGDFVVIKEVSVGGPCSNK